MTSPDFIHPEIENLYSYGIDIPHEILKEILALPQETLIQDLEKVLDDSSKRYEYFMEQDWDEKTQNFVLHALVILAEINTKESLPIILNYLKNDAEFVENWLDDHLTYTIWQIIYKVGINNTGLLQEFLLLQNINTYCKSSVSEALTQMVIYHPEKRDEIFTIYSETLTELSKLDPDGDDIDYDFLGLFIGDTLECGFVELLPLIKVFYDKDMIDSFLLSNYKEFEKEFAKKESEKYKRKILNIFEIYEDILTNWAGYNGKDTLFNFQKSKPITVNKIGRNDPCPCGSGKKYKKCCLE